MTGTAARFDTGELRNFANKALVAAGLTDHLAQVVAEVLVEGDLMGHDTHGLALLPSYLTALQNAGMTTEGSPEILRDRTAAALWDGKFLPGPWLITEGFRIGIERAREAGTFSLSIQRSHHTASLVAYLRPVVEAGMVGFLAVSDPTEVCVVPFGGTRPVLSTNPIAWGFPGETGGHILIDVSTSATTNGMVNRLHKSGERFQHNWLADNQGRATNDPAVRFGEPVGSILPLGGIESGHKGTGLGIATEGLTHALSGHGRHTAPRGWQANVFLQVIDPEAFGGRQAMESEVNHLRSTIRNTPPADPMRPVRVPGDRALQNRARQLSQGVSLADSILVGLQEWARKLNIGELEAQK